MVLGLLVGLVGSMASLTSPGWSLEQEVGLSWLFTLRGKVAAPADTVVVVLDKESAARFEQPEKIRNWARSLHAELIDRLTQRGAAVIVFDVFFEASRDTGGDRALALAMQRSKRVALFQRVERERTPALTMDSLVTPTPVLTAAAAGLGPFPLPKVPNRVNQVWAFYHAVGNVATLPIVALQIYTLQRLGYANFIAHLQQAGFPSTEALPSEPESAQDLRALIDVLRGGFRSGPGFAQGFIKQLDKSLGLSPDNKGILTAVAKMYAQGDSYFLNYYGPAGTITTIPYRALWDERADSAVLPDLTGKAVFVGATHVSLTDRVDDFHTVFSTEDGIDLTGVEIAATAFANLLDDRALRPVGKWAGSIILFLLGILGGWLGYRLSGVRAAIAIVVLGAGYLFTAALVFANHSLWMPTFLPLVVQLPLALTLGLWWQFLGARHTSEKVTRAIHYYMPRRAAERLVEEGQPSTAVDIDYGVCLFTDVSGYTTLTEEVSPAELAKLSNEYFALLGDRLGQWQGEMMGFGGDGMVGLWTEAQPAKTARLRACCAALDILEDVEDFNNKHPDQPFHTRIGLHAGSVVLGNVGGGGHYSYVARGDIMNTASRIEGLSKLLHTRLLAEESVVRDLDELLVRRVGAFVLKGKHDALTIYEILCRQETATRHQQQLCAAFETALNIFKDRQWWAAERDFKQVLTQHPDDGPSRFYRDRCRQCATAKRAEDASTTIRIETK